MKLYIVLIREYEDRHIGFCSMSLDAVVNYINNHFNCNDNYEEFNIMECWKDDKRKFVYGENMNDVVRSKYHVVKKEIKKDILKYINNK